MFCRINSSFASNRPQFQEMQVFHRLGFRPQSTGYCTLGTGRNFTACEFFPRKSGEVDDHVHCANRTKYAGRESFSTPALLLQLLWKTMWNLSIKKPEFVAG